MPEGIFLAEGFSIPAMVGCLLIVVTLWHHATRAARRLREKNKERQMSALET